MNNKQIIKLTYAALCLALCMALPLITGQIPEVGNMLCPMHIPVLLAGYLCGPWWALAVGAIAPVLRFALFSMPPVFPTGFAMCFELATYGLLSGYLYNKSKTNNLSIYISLIAAMISGRVAWGIVMFALTVGGATEFTFMAFITLAFINAIPGIILHIIIIPIIVIALRKAKLC